MKSVIQLTFNVKLEHECSKIEAIRKIESDGIVSFRKRVGENDCCIESTDIVEIKDVSYRLLKPNEVFQFGDEAIESPSLSLLETDNDVWFPIVDSIGSCLAKRPTWVKARRPIY